MFRPEQFRARLWSFNLLAEIPQLSNSNLFLALLFSLLFRSFYLIEGSRQYVRCNLVDYEIKQNHNFKQENRHANIKMLAIIRLFDLKRKIKHKNKWTDGMVFEFRSLPVIFGGVTNDVIGVVGNVVVFIVVFRVSHVIIIGDVVR